MKKLLIVFGLLLCPAFAQNVLAQLPTESGRVVDFSTGAAVPDVKVSAILFCTPITPTLPKSTWVNTAITGADGKYLVTYPFGPLTPPSCALRENSFTISKDGFTFVRRKGLDNDRDYVGIRTDLPQWTGVPAASYKGNATSEMIMAAFGAELAGTIEAASHTPLPTTLAGRTIKVVDYEGVEKHASFFFVSPTQINYLLPAGLASGPAIVSLNGADGFIRIGILNVQKLAPAIFTADTSGQGLAAAVILRIRSDGSQQYEPVQRFDSVQGKIVPVPIDLGPETDRIILVLFGTGWRQATSDSNVRVTLQSSSLDPPGVIGNTIVHYAGAQPTIIGLDQINAEIPRSLAGTGEAHVFVAMKGDLNEDVIANKVQVYIK